MDKLIESLARGARVLDLGAGTGSFQSSRADLEIVRLDLKVPHTRGSGQYILSTASRLPFRSATFDAVIANHTLEHFEDLDEVLREIGRVVRPNAGLYVAVPDAATLADRIYRWLGRGGGHLNPFYSATGLAGQIERLTGLAYRGSVTLFSSLAFLNRNNFIAPPPRRIVLFGGGNERFLAIFVWLLRRIDQTFRSRLSHYGWALYFGSAVPAYAAEQWINVCVRCGAGASEVWLRKKGAIPPLPRRFNWYRCPTCGGLNLLTPE